MTISSAIRSVGAPEESLDELRERIRRRRARRLPLVSSAAPLVVSIAIHAAILLATAAVVWRIASHQPIPEPVVISFDDPAPAPAPTAPASANAVPEAPTPSSFPPTTAAIGAADKPLFAASAPANAATDIESGADLFPSAPTAPINNLASDQPTIPVAGRDVGFAGLGASSVRSVVYVVDASGPMVTSLPQVLAEVGRSVSRLSPNQKFSIILCREVDEATPGLRIFSTSPRWATTRALTDLAKWLDGAAPQGRSAPLRGLEAALAMKPDAVFLLSRAIDRTGGGEWGQGLDATMARLEQLNPKLNDAGRRAIVIKTIQFLDEDPTGIMQAIGHAHGGHEASGAAAGDAGYRVVTRHEELESP